MCIRDRPRDTVGSIGMRLVTNSQPRDTVGSTGMRLVTDSQPRDTVGSIGMRLVTDSQLVGVFPACPTMMQSPWLIGFMLRLMACGM